jgi:tetratricopeptide (TPR) repeat protein
MAFHLLGDAYSRQLKWDEAVAALQKSIWINPYFSGPYILLGKAYMKKGDMAAAEGMLRQAVQYDPNNKAAHYLLGQLLQQTGRPDEARKELETAERLPGAGQR